MEKAVDIVVARLVRLRLLCFNGTWTRYWAGRFAALLRPLPAPA